MKYTLIIRWISAVIRRHNITQLKRILYFIEFLCVISSIYLSYLMVSLYWMGMDKAWEIHAGQFAFYIILILISWYVSSQASSMSKLPRIERYRYFFFSHIRISFLVMIVLVMLKYILALHSIPLMFVISYVSFSMVFHLGLKFFATRILRIYRYYGHNIRQIIVIADEHSIPVIDRLITQKEWGFKVKYIITDAKPIIQRYGNDIQILSDNSTLKSILDNSVVDEIIYCKKELYENEIKAIMYICQEVGVIFRFQSLVSPVGAISMQMTTMNNQEQLTLTDVSSNKLSLLIKNMADLYFSATAIIILSPVWLLIALIIKLESKGPVFFKQERIGLRGRKFTLYKFRSMVINAGELLERLKANNEMDGPTFKMKNDPRITRFGKFLRKTGLDELPQLINVLAGEMSLIGPRPPLESEVKQYERWQLRRLSVKPGITCTWQIIPNRNDVKFEKWMQLDLGYIDNWTLTKDIQLFFKTITTIFLASGR